MILTLMTTRCKFKWTFKMYRLLFKTSVDLDEILSVPSICYMSKDVTQRLSKNGITDTFLCKHRSARRRDGSNQQISNYLINYFIANPWPDGVSKSLAHTAKIENGENGCREHHIGWSGSIQYTTLRLKKNIPDVFSYNSRKHCRIFIIFGKNISKKANNQKLLYFPTSPN